MSTFYINANLKTYYDSEA